MCLLLNARPSTADVDAIFQPATRIRKAATRVALQMNVSEDWLNDGVKGYLSDRGDYSNYLELSHLKVLVASKPYLLAMKCMAMRIGVEFHDIEDIRFLLRSLNIFSYDSALEVIAQYYPIDQLPQKTLYALAELLPKNH